MISHQWVSVYLMFFAFGGFIFFLEGYFPLKYHGGSEAGWKDLPSDINGKKLNAKGLYIGNKTRVVLMVIDALRYDFVAPNYMPYTSELIKNQTACLYKAKAETPTVTMPRIKSTYWKRDKAQWRRTLNLWRDIFAMTTGSVSNFIDVVLNFGTSAISDDSFLNQAKLNRKTMVFYGDDTWLRLFPDVFNRSDGTTSFFVSDYTEVDHNVTRHLPKELPSSGHPDWDLMVLHYLGLDHIGHLEGPASPKVEPKMREMDGIVQMITKAAEKWEDETVLLICGDHGMKDSGSHGGASYSEVMVPLIITQKKGCANMNSLDVKQIDIAVTISYLLGVPLPTGSTGQILPQILGAGKDGNLISQRALYALYYNTKMNSDALVKTLGEEQAHNRASYKQYLSAVKYHSDWLSDERKNLASGKMALKLYQSSMDNMSEFLSKIVVDFDMFAIILGIILIVLTIVTQILTLSATYQEYQPQKKNPNPFCIAQLLTRLAMMVIISIIWRIPYEVLCGMLHPNSFLCSATPLGVSFFTASCVIVICNCVILLHVRNVPFPSFSCGFNLIEICLIVGTLIHSFMCAGTSFIEEEHMTWYYLWITEAFFVFVYTASVLVEYIRMKQENSTEIQDKGDLETQMRVTGKWLLPQWILLMILHRLLRTLNQTGDKWAFLPDTGDWLNEDENKDVLSLVTGIALACTFYICLTNIQNTSKHFVIQSILMFSSIICIFVYRATIQAVHLPLFGYPDLNEITIVHLFWLMIIAMILLEFFTTTITICNNPSKSGKSRSKSTIEDVGKRIYDPLNQSKSRHTESAVKIQIGMHPSSQLFGMSGKPQFAGDCLKMKVMSSRTGVFVNIVILVCCLYLRPHNLILVPSLCWTSKAINEILDYRFGTKGRTVKNEVMKKNLFCKALFHFWIGAVFFFYQGNSNSIASADLSAGYVGLETYIPSVVALQLGIHTYTGPLLAFFFMFADCVKQSAQWDTFQQRLKEFLATYSVVKIWELALYLIIAVILRYHLFVWTVISPKLLYDFTSLFFSLAGVIIIVFMCCLVSLQVNLARRLSSPKDGQDEEIEVKDL